MKLQQPTNMSGAKSSRCMPTDEKERYERVEPSLYLNKGGFLLLFSKYFLNNTASGRCHELIRTNYDEV